jgi:hypothetical protein
LLKAQALNHTGCQLAKLPLPPDLIWQSFQQCSIILFNIVFYNFAMTDQSRFRFGEKQQAAILLLNDN